MPPPNDTCRHDVHHSVLQPFGTSLWILLLATVVFVAIVFQAIQMADHWSRYKKMQQEEEEMAKSLREDGAEKPGRKFVRK